MWEEVELLWRAQLFESTEICILRLSWDQHSVGGRPKVKEGGETGSDYSWVRKRGRILIRNFSVCAPSPWNCLFCHPHDKHLLPTACVSPVSVPNAETAHCNLITVELSTNDQITMTAAVVMSCNGCQMLLLSLSPVWPHNSHTPKASPGGNCHCAPNICLRGVWEFHGFVFDWFVYTSWVTQLRYSHVKN